MLQRIQTLYLLFATVITLVAIYFFSYQDTSILLENSRAVFMIFIVKLAVSAFLSILSIFLYKNRLLQIKLGKLNILINLLLVGLLSYYLLNLPGELNFSEKGIGMMSSIISSILFLFLANRAIKRDDNLVKSVDRLR